jgi:ubiquitin-protein ligase
MSAVNDTIVLKKDTISRLIKDVKEIIKNPLTSHGIYYQHHESDMLKGQALVIGPKDTPYENGYYLFELAYPANYPHAPPVVKYFTNDGYTRFNPNLYKCGKVCLSILNTWRGDQWSACQTISSVLLALCTVFNEMPLLNEPGIHKGHPDCTNYTKVIHYKNYEIAILRMFKQIVLATDADAPFPAFKEIIKTHFAANYAQTKARIEAILSSTTVSNASVSNASVSNASVSNASVSASSTTNETINEKNAAETLHIGIYNMTLKIDYRILLHKFQDIL